MSDKEQKKKLVNEATMKVIENTPSISFVEFKHIDTLRERLPPPVTFSVEPWEELAATKERNNDAVAAWITDMFKSEGISGRVIFMFGDFEIQGAPDFAEVIISDTYQWVAPLWKRGNSLSLTSFEKGYSWKIFSFDDRYAFLRIRLTKD